MACPNFKKGLKMVSELLGIKRQQLMKTRDEMHLH
jgi:hypothetical protein